MKEGTDFSNVTHYTQVDVQPGGINIQNVEHLYQADILKQLGIELAVKQKGEAEVVGKEDCLTGENSSEVGNQLITNDIFNDELFNSNERLMALRDTIVSGITGKDSLDLASGNEWYWLYAALYDAGFLETRKNRDNVVTDAGFVRQIAKWLFNIVGIIDEERVRQICKSMSAERGKWMMNGQPLSLVDLEANKRRLRAMKESKINRIIHVAYEQLYLPLMKLKEDMKATR